MVIDAITRIFKDPDLRNKILFILGVFVIFRIMANIPIPGVNAENLSMFFDQAQFFGLLNLFTGGALQNISMVMLGLGPYITAVIVLQLLTMIVPALERMYKEEGEEGRKKFNQYGRMLTVPFAMIQSYGMLSFLSRPPVEAIDSMSFSVMFSAMLVITAGTIFLMWLGELISEKGIGNGISLLIFAGIMASFTGDIGQMAVAWDPTLTSDLLLFAIISFFIVVFVVYLNEATRNIPVSYAKRVRGAKMYGGISTYLPLKINPAGVIPIIFAISVLLLPPTLASVLAGTEGIIGDIAQRVADVFERSLGIYALFYFFLVVAFTFFYTAVIFDPKKVAENLQKMGGFVPGIRPGQSTVQFLAFVVKRVLLVGAVWLGIVAILPFFVSEATGIQGFDFLIGGTAVLIAVNVVLEMMRQIRAQLQMREYDTF